MVKYIINCGVHGYEKITEESSEIQTVKDDLFIFVMNKSYDEKLVNTYKALETVIKNGNRVILIGVTDENTTFRPLASLMLTYRAYDIYTVDSIDDVNGNYLISIENRTPDITEVKSFIGGDLTAYQDMVTILFGIQSLVQEGEEEKLRDFLDEHVESIQSLVVTINEMKKKCDLINTDELFDKIKELQEEQENLGKVIEEQKKSLKDTKYDRDNYKVQYENSKKEIKDLNEQVSDMKKTAEYGGSVIKSYKEINTQLINCKTKIVLYFKEVSYVTYTNTMVLQLLNVLETHKLKAKLVIYDSQTGLYMTYKPLPIIFGNDYISMKDTLVNKTKIFVAAEPNQSILNDLLTADNSVDVLVVYDRMKNPNDLVSGNNVTKFYIVNSNHDYREASQVLKIPDTSHVITHATTSIDETKTGKSDRHFLDIPHITGFTGLTDSAKTSKYMRAQTSFTKELLINTILKKSRINTLINI